MSKEAAIVVENLSKRYKLYLSRQDRIKEWLHPKGKKYHQVHKALENISFTLHRGEILGIIGKNGSGKSTLLKILASVVTPTSGSVTSHGRITALLELSGGFNPELSGIENVYYLGSIQGFTKEEMKSRVEEILAFADIGDYAYQPVKTYSSGMAVRLAFSLSINIDPDILITDEALAVGDLRFQQKCYRKIRAFKEAGKTILICTHSMSVLTDFCTRAIWLDNGEIRQQGDPGFVAEQYSQFMKDRQLNTKIHAEETHNDAFGHCLSSELIPEPLRAITWSNLSLCDTQSKGSVRIRYAVLVDSTTLQPKNPLQGGEEVSLFLLITSEQWIGNASFQLTLNNKNGISVFKIMNSRYQHTFGLPKENRPAFLSVQFPFPHLSNGQYTLSLVIKSPEGSETDQYHIVHDAIIVEVANVQPPYTSESTVVIPQATFQVFKSLGQKKLNNH